MTHNLFDDPPRHEPARPSRPMGIAVADLCPHCNRILKPVHAFEADGECLKFYRCPQDGDVVPMRSAVANLPAAVWDGEGP